MSSGTLLDSLRFRTHLAEALGVDPRSVQANVLGEHGTSAVEHWSAVEVGGVPLAAVLERVGKRIEQVRPRVEDAVRGANLNIIQGIGASQYGIGAVTARLVEAVLRDERVVVPVGSYRPEAGVTYFAAERGRGGGGAGRARAAAGRGGAGQARPQHRRAAPRRRAAAPGGGRVVRTSEPLRRGLRDQRAVADWAA